MTGPSAPPAWLTARPIAHRGLHDRHRFRYENSLSAARAAVEAGFSIECDVQRSADGEAMVFHDFTLERLTATDGAVADRPASVLAATRLGKSEDCIPTLSALLAAIGGRVPLVCEIKSAFDDDDRLTHRVAAVAGGYQGPLAVKSFDPAVVARLRARPDLEGVPLGIVAEARYEDPDYEALSAGAKERLAALVDAAQAQPDFLSYRVGDLPHAAATLFRSGLNRPVLAWTVRTDEQRERAGRWADQMVFEGFDPRNL